MTDTQVVPENKSEGIVEETSLLSDAQAPEQVEEVKDVVQPEATEPEVQGEKADEPEAEEQQQDEGAPESYDEFSMPEGVGSLDEDVIAAFSEAAKELNLSQAKAQAFLDKVLPAQAAQRQKLVESWVAESQSDKEFGGDKLQANLAVADKAYKSFASPALQQVLKDTGLNNHPEIIRMFVQVGQRLSDDSIVNKGDPSTDAGPAGDAFLDPERAMRKLFPTHSKK